MGCRKDKIPHSEYLTTLSTLFRRQRLSAYDLRSRTLDGSTVAALLNLLASYPKTTLSLECSLFLDPMGNLHLSFSDPSTSTIQVQIVVNRSSSLFGRMREVIKL